MSQYGSVVHVDDVGAGVRLRRRWWVVGLGLLLGLAAAAAVTAAQPVRYAATTSVLVLATDVDTSLSSSRPEVNMDTEAELVRSAQVAEATRSILGAAASADSLREGLEVTVPLNSQILAITYTDRTAASAQAGAQAFAEGYLGFRSDGAQRDLVEKNAALQADLVDAQQQLRLATDKAAALPANSPDRVYAEAQRGILSNQISSLSARLSALRAASPTPGQVITAAVEPTTPRSPTPRLNYAAGLVGGLLLGLALAAVVNRVDHRVWHWSDVPRLVGRPVLLKLRPAADAPWPHGVDAAAFDRLRNLLFSPADGPPPQLIQVSHPGGALSSHVAAGLAQSLVRAADRAVLVLAHPDSSVPDWLDVGHHDGFTEVLRGDADLEASLVTYDGIPGLQVLLPGREPQLLANGLQSREARAVLDALRSSGALCVVETEGTDQSAAAQAVAMACDVVVLVASKGETDHRVLSAAATAATSMGADVAGVVLLSPARRRLQRRHRESNGSSLADVPTAPDGTAAPLAAPVGNDVAARSAGDTTCSPEAPVLARSTAVPAYPPR